LALDVGLRTMLVCTPMRISLHPQGSRAEGQLAARTWRSATIGVRARYIKNDRIQNNHSNPPQTEPLKYALSLSHSTSPLRKSNNSPSQPILSKRNLQTATMISDSQLYSLAVFLGSAAVLLIVLYHFLEINAKDAGEDLSPQRKADALPAKAR
jgi:oligosaccharyl transferase complex subunit OST4